MGRHSAHQDLGILSTGLIKDYRHSREFWIFVWPNGVTRCGQASTWIGEVTAPGPEVVISLRAP